MFDHYDNTYLSILDDDSGYTREEWDSEAQEADAAALAAIEHPLCAAPRSLRSRGVRTAAPKFAPAIKLPPERARVVHEHGDIPCHLVPDHRPAQEVRWRTPRALGLPWGSTEFVLVGPEAAMVPGTHVVVTHKNGSTARAYVESLGPRTTCGGRVGYTR